MYLVNAKVKINQLSTINNYWRRRDGRTDGRTLGAASGSGGLSSHRWSLPGIGELLRCTARTSRHCSPGWGGVGFGGMGVWGCVVV